MECVDKHVMNLTAIIPNSKLDQILAVLVNSAIASFSRSMHKTK